jgi:hypothetical protein
MSDAGAIRQTGESEGRIPFRVRLGVTGHRQLENEPRIRIGISEQLARVRSLFAPTEVTDVTYTILTALAEGADRLVPTIAPAFLGVGVVEIEAVLPLTVEDYRHDFRGEASRQEFTRLLATSASRVELTHEKSVTGDARVAAYLAAGRYIVDHSDVLIAVWNGAAGHGPGGTADIVGYARARGVPVLIVPSGGDGPASVVPEAQGSAPRFRAAAGAIQRIDEYNRDSVASGRFRDALASARLQHQVPPDSAIAPQVQAVSAWAVPRYVRADVLALRHQSDYAVLARLIHFLAAFAVAAVAAVVVFAPGQTGWLGFEIFLLLALMLVVGVGRRGGVRERWLGYRSLAEAFRSAMFISIAGIRDPDQSEIADVGDSSDPWFQRAFSEAWRSHPPLTLEESQAKDLRSFIVKEWIDDQIAFHERTAARHCKRRAQYTWTVYVLAAITIVVAALHIAHWPESAAWRDAFTFIAITLPGFGAAVTGLREHGQHRLHEERSRRTAERLRRLKTQRGEADLAGVRALVADAHRVIVEENVGWSGVMEFQDLEMVI